MTVFGFSWTYSVALIARIGCGAANGASKVIKSDIGEIPGSDRVRNFAYLSLVRGVGQTMGPIVSGFLRGAWDQYPFALPCIVAGVMAFLSFVLNLIFFPDKRIDQESKTGSWIFMFPVFRYSSHYFIAILQPICSLMGYV